MTSPDCELRRRERAEAERILASLEGCTPGVAADLIARAIREAVARETKIENARCAEHEGGRGYSRETIEDLKILGEIAADAVRARGGDRA